MADHPIAGVAGGGPNAGEPARAAPAAAVPAAGSSPPVAVADPAPPANPLPPGTQAPSPELPTEPTSPEPVAASIAPPATRADPAAARAEAPPADPEQVLREAGLVLEQDSYILSDEIEAESIPKAIHEIKAGLDQRMSQYQALMGHYLRGVEAATKLRYWVEAPESNSFNRSDAEKIAGEVGLKWREALALEEPMFADRMVLWREQTRYGDLVDRIPRRYAALAADPRIRAALRALNRGRQPKLALGPVAAYQKNLLKQSNELLRHLGYLREGDLYWLAKEAELIKQVNLAHRLWREIALYEPRLAPPGQATSAPEATRPVPARSSADVAPATKEARPATAPAMKPLTAAQFAAKRAEFGYLVRELRRQADALQKRREVLQAEGEARDALDQINRTKDKTSQARLGTHPGLKQVLQNLEAMERAVQTEEVPRTRDVELLSGDIRRNNRPAPLVVDPAADSPRAAEDITELPRYTVLHIPDGNSITVRKPGEVQVQVRLLGVASPPR